MIDIEIVHLTPQEILDHREGIYTVYRDAFAAAPYFTQSSQVAHFVDDTLPRHILRNGLRFVVARDIVSETLVGFAYGYSGEAGHWWHDIIAQALEAQTAQTWLLDAFEFVELAVSPAAQGHGIGGQLHDALLASAPHARALMSTHASETVAFHLYRKRGWVMLHDNFYFPGGTLPFVIMGLDLAQATWPDPGADKKSHTRRHWSQRPD